MQSPHDLIRRWTYVPIRVANPSFRIFCLPYAGGRATIYQEWPAYLPSSVEVIGIQLPGRSHRPSDRPIEDMGQLVTAMLVAIGPLLDRPFAFFGHSMGAIIAYEAARKIVASRRFHPTHLIVSAHRAPSLLSRTPPIHNLSDDDLMEELGRLEGTPRELLSDRELMQLLLPSIRADLKLIETYQCSMDANRLSCPVIAVGGVDDQETSQDELLGWSSITSGPFHLHMLPGKHFFLHEEKSALLSIVRGICGVDKGY